MSLRRPRFSEEEPAEAINISPLIDVIFILLIFFIVTMVFADGVNLKIDIPESSQNPPLNSHQVTIAISSSGEAWLDGKSFTLSELELELKMRFSSQGESVLLRSDSAVPVSRLVEIMDCAKNAGAKEIYVAAKTK